MSRKDAYSTIKEELQETLALVAEKSGWEAGTVMELIRAVRLTEKLEAPAQKPPAPPPAQEKSPGEGNIAYTISPEKLPAAKVRGGRPHNQYSPDAGRRSDADADGAGGEREKPAGALHRHDFRQGQGVVCTTGKRPGADEAYL